MPSIWCSISGHGFGHAAQVVPVLNELGKRVPRVTALLHTSVPTVFFQSRLTIPWQLNSAQQDIGCIQHGPLQIDVPATWEAHRRFHVGWETRVRDTAAMMARQAPRLVLSDISHLGTAAGGQAGIPTVALCSLSWDVVLEHYTDPQNQEQHAIIQHIRDAYAGAERLLRPTPGIALTAFRDIIDIGPICAPGTPDPLRLRTAVQASHDDYLVLVGFGGIAQRRLPFQAMEGMAPFRFVADAPVPAGLRRVHSSHDFGWPFPALFASVDLVMTKPGYGTIVEAVALQKPVVYVRRYQFADEDSLVTYLHRYGRGAELSAADFHAGRWMAALTAATKASPVPWPAPAPTGAAEAAAHLISYF